MRVHKNLFEEALRRARAMLAGIADAGEQESPVIEADWHYNGRGMATDDTCLALVTTAAGITAFALSADDVLIEGAANIRSEPEEDTVTSWWDLLPLMWQEERDKQTVFYFPGLTVEE